MKERFKAIPAVFVILWREKTDARKSGAHSTPEIFLLQRKNTGYMDGFWTLPAGHIERGEDAVAAAARETLEETGVEIAPEKLTLAHLNYRLCTQEICEGLSPSSRIDFYFTTPNLEIYKPNGCPATPYNAEPEKAATGKWFELTALPKQVVPCVKFVLDQIYSQHQTYSTLTE